MNERLCQSCHKPAEFVATWSYGASDLCGDCIELGERQAQEIDAHEAQLQNEGYSCSGQMVERPKLTPIKSEETSRAEALARMANEIFDELSFLFESILHEPDDEKRAQYDAELREALWNNKAGIVRVLKEVSDADFFKKLAKIQAGVA